MSARAELARLVLPMLGIRCGNSMIVLQQASFQIWLWGYISGKRSFPDSALGHSDRLVYESHRLESLKPSLLLAFSRILARLLAKNSILFETDCFRQSTIQERWGPLSKCLAPRSVLGLRPQELFQAVS